MYYKLKEDILLRGWDKLPYAIADKNKRYPIFISKKEMQALELCCGSIDVSLPIIPKELKDLLPMLEEKGYIIPCSAGDEITKKQEYKKYPARYMRSVHWSVTGRCNYRCRHCYMEAPDAKYGELSHEAALDIAQQIIDCGIREVSLTGGEPLVRKDFFDIVDTLLAGGVKISTIYSNGKLVTDALLSELEKRGIYPEFNISYDGTDGAHDWLRGIDGAGKAAEDAFMLCKKRGFPTGAEMCLHDKNKHLLRKTVKRLGEMGVRSLKTNPIADIGAWKEGGYKNTLLTDELFDLYLKYIPQYYEDGMPLALHLGGFFMASPKDADRYSIPSVHKCTDPGSHKICNHARLVMYISAEGRALPCMALSGMEIQKNYPLVTDIGIQKCITDSSYMSLIDTTAKAVIDHNKECSECMHKNTCLGGCRAAALETSPDDILAKDEACCRIHKGGYIKKIDDIMKKTRPSAKRI